MAPIEITLLGRFGVRLGDRDVDDSAWPRRSASDLVKLLALAPGRRMHRERIVDALWPAVPPDQARRRLHTATHYARRALGDDTAVSRRGDLLTLFPASQVDVD